MELKNEIKIKNYKCFDEAGQGFDQVLPINVIIGKNNSGKSSLIELVQFLTNGNNDFFDNARDNSTPEILITYRVTGDKIARAFPKNETGGDINGNHYLYGKRFIDSKIQFILGKSNARQFASVDNDVPIIARVQFNKLVHLEDIPLRGKIFRNISAERDINPEIANLKISVEPNGSGATNFIQEIINKNNQDSNLIEKKLLSELNKIVEPDMSFNRILVQLNDANYWEIYFIDNHNNRVALSKMGSGIKTVILVLLNLVVLPEIDGKDSKIYVFAFEELENNLHPSLQRRLYDYIKKYSYDYRSYFFLTTHSNIVIDTFSTSKETQLLHVKNDGLSSKCTTVVSYAKTKNIIEDLGLKASDILQTNGVIWVEGPSDRNFLNRWLSIIDSDLKEGLHYTIMFYGGRLLSNLSFDFDWLQKELIPLLTINRNAYVVIDRDGKGITSKLNETKKRIGHEIGEDNCWITRGREIENYLSQNTINSWLKKAHKISVNVTNNKNIKLEDNISNSKKGVSLKYNRNKTVFSHEIAKYIVLEDMKVLDLSVRVKTLAKKIRHWNS